MTLTIGLGTVACLAFCIWFCSRAIAARRDLNSYSGNIDAWDHWWSMSACVQVLLLQGAVASAAASLFGFLALTVNIQV